MPQLDDLNIDQIITGNTDDRGRLYIGPEYSNIENLRVAILETEQDGGD